MGCGASRSQAKNASSPQQINSRPDPTPPAPGQLVFNKPEPPSVAVNSSASLAPIASAPSGAAGSAYPYLPPVYSNLHNNGHTNSNHSTGYLTVKLPRPEEEGPEPAILFEDERPKVSKEIIKLDDVPKYVSQNCTPNGRWAYHAADKEEPLPQDVQVLIERSYVRGDPMVFFELNGVPTEFTYGESVIILNANGETSVYPTVRMPMGAEPYHRITEDGSMRPFPKELQDAIRLAGGEMVFILDNKPYQIIASKNSLVDLSQGVSIKMSIMN